MKILSNKGMLYVEYSNYILILDTGSNISIIDASYINDENIDKDNTHIMGISNIMNAIGSTYIDGHKFFVSDISNVLSSLRKGLRVKVHGILGTDYLIKNKLILDLDEMQLCRRDR